MTCAFSLQNLVRGLLLVLIAALLSACQTTKDSFALIDTNRDGKLTADEVENHGFRQIFNRLDKNNDELITSADLKGGTTNVMAQRDLNKDGKVTLEEYSTVGRRLGMVKKFYMAADANGDGVITRQEQKAYSATNKGLPLGQ